MGIMANMLRELRSSLATPEKWLVDWVNGGGETNAGATVNEDTALTFAAVWCAVQILSGTVMQLPLILYRKTGDDGKERATNHPLYHIFKHKVNGRMTSQRWLETSVMHLATRGNTYSQIEYNRRNGAVAGLHLLQPHRMHPETQAGNLQYRYTMKTGGEIILRPDEVLHIPGLGYDGIMGYSAITLARESLGLGMAAEEFGARYFGEGTHPSAIGTMPGHMKEDAKKQLRKDLTSKYSGLGKSHKFLLLEDDVKIQQISVSPEDSQFLQTRQFQVTEVARWFNLPPHMLKDLDRATHSNIEHQSIEFMTVNMGPWLTRIETEIASQLLYSDQLDEYYFEFKREALLKGDTASRYQAYATARQWGWMSANDVRRKENEEPLGEQGDIYMVPVNMISAEMVANPPAPAQGQRNVTEPETRDAGAGRETRATETGRIRIAGAYRRLFHDAAGRVVRREVNDIRKAVEKQLGTRGLDDFKRWLADYYKDAPEWIRKNMSPVTTAFAEEIYSAASDEIGTEFEPSAETDRYLADYITYQVSGHIGNSRGQIDKIIRETEPEDIADAIEERLGEWDETRAEKIADSETVRGRSAFAMAVFFAAGFRAVWKTTGGSTCPYCTKMNGRVVGRGEYFLGEGDELTDGDEGTMVIRGPMSHPPLHRGCDCVIVYEQV